MHANKLSLWAYFSYRLFLKYKNREKMEKRADLKRGKAPYPKNRTTKSG